AESQETTAFSHHRDRALRYGGQGVAGNVEAVDEVFPSGGQITPLELLLVRVGDGMHDEVKMAPLLLEGGEDRVDGLFACHIARQDKLALHRFCQRKNALRKRLSLKIGRASCREKMKDMTDDVTVAKETRDKK